MYQPNMEHQEFLTFCYKKKWWNSILGWYGGSLDKTPYACMVLNVATKIQCVLPTSFMRSLVLSIKPTFGWYGGLCHTENNELSILTLHIWLVWWGSVNVMTVLRHASVGLTPIIVTKKIVSMECALIFGRKWGL